MKYLMAFGCAALVLASSVVVVRAEDGASEKQPVFLLCPSHERYGSWSLYLNVDKNDPSKVLGLGLEELLNKNSKDEGGYEKVLDAQRNPSTPREEIGTLDAKSFGSGSIRVQKNEALTVTCTPAGADYSLMINMRISADGHFIIGGDASEKRSVVLKYNSALKKWSAYATVLLNEKGQNAVGALPLPISGLGFPVTGTGIYRIVAGVQGGAVIVYDGNDR